VSDNLTNYTFEQVAPPLSAKHLWPLKGLWEEIFKTSYDGQMDVLEGRQRDYSQDLFYLAWGGPRIAASAHLTISKAVPVLAGLGEVATATEHRGQGLALTLCRNAVRDFEQGNGQAIFLGTGNPIAAKVYRKAGWLYLPGTGVMVNTLNRQLPEEFLLGLFSGSGAVTPLIRPMNPGDRVSIIPLILFGHPWIALDMNAELFSTRFFVQGSCMGLYPRYEKIIKDQGSVWILEHPASHLPVGILSVKVISGDRVSLDGFVHPFHANQFQPFCNFVLGELKKKQFKAVVTCVLENDFEKEQSLAQLNFASHGTAGEHCCNSVTLKYKEMLHVL